MKNEIRNLYYEWAGKFFSRQRLQKWYERKDLKNLKKAYKFGNSLANRQAINFIGKLGSQGNYEFLMSEMKSAKEHLRPYFYAAIKEMLQNETIQVSPINAEYWKDIWMNYANEKELISRIDNLLINGLKLPDRIIQRIKNNQWKVPLDKSNLEKLVIGKDPFRKGFSETAQCFELYELTTMRTETINLDQTMFLGGPDKKNLPGYIDFDKIILFADFGIGEEAPLALDYRDDMEKPSVSLFCEALKDEESRWIRISDSFKEFEKMVWKK